MKICIFSSTVLVLASGIFSSLLGQGHASQFVGDDVEDVGSGGGRRLQETDETTHSYPAGGGGRRHLSSSSATPLDEEAFQGVKELCGDVEYDVSLYVTNHIFLVAVPTDIASGKEHGCLPLAFHAGRSSEEGGLMRKAVLQMDDDEVIAIVQEDSISLTSTYKLGAIAASYEMSEVNAAGANGYDIVQNNCGDFIKEMGKNMEIKMTKDQTVAIAARLTEYAGETYGKSIKESSYVDSLIGDLKVKMVTQKLVERLVETRTKELY